MANIVALSSGYFSDSNIWSTNSIPTTGDVVFSNNRIIWIDTDIACGRLTNKADSTISPISAAAGGVFNVLSSVNINVGLFDTGATTLMQLSANCSPTITGQINGGTVAAARGVDNLGTGTLTIVGLVSGGNGVISSTNFAEGVRSSSTGNIILSGSAIGGFQASNHAIHNFGNGNVTVYGDLSGSIFNTGQALRFNRGGNCTVYGNIYGNAGYGLVINAFVGDTNTVLLSGNLYAPINRVGAGYAFYTNSNGGTTTIYGNIYGSQGPAGLAMNASLWAAQISQAAGECYVYGDCYGATGNANACGGLYVNGGVTLSPLNFTFVGNLYGGNSPWGVANHQGKHAMKIDLANANLTCGVIRGGQNSLSNVRTFAQLSYGLNFTGALSAVANVTVPELRGDDCWYSPNIYVNNAGATLNITTNSYDDLNVNIASVAYYRIGINSGILNYTGNVYAKDFNIAGMTYDTPRNSIVIGSFTSTTTMNFTGQIFGGICGTAVYSGGGVTNATKIVGNRFGPMIYGINQQPSGYAWYGLAVTSKLIVDEIEAGEQGNFPALGPIYLKDSATSKITLKRPSSNSLTQTFVDPLSSNTYPLSSDVRFGISYAAGNLTGSCYVPSPSAVAYSVPVDNTTGQAILSIDNLLNFDVAETGSNSIWKRLKNCSTVSSTGGQLAALV